MIWLGTNVCLPVLAHCIVDVADIVRCILALPAACVATHISSVSASPCKNLKLTQQAQQMLHSSFASSRLGTTKEGMHGKLVPLSASSVTI